MLNDWNILINDSCVLFDLYDLGLLQDFFRLGYKFYTTPQVIMEITDDDQLTEIQQYIDSGELNIDSKGTLDSIQSLYNHYPGLSYTDSSVLELTIRINGILLSSDKGLRNITKRQNIQVRGVLWIIEKMVDVEVLSVHLAIDKLQAYPKINLRAPQNEINKFIEFLQVLNK